MTAKEDFYRQFQEYLRIVYLGRWIILAIFIVVMASTWFYTLQQDDIYQSRTAIRLKRALDPLNYQASQGLGAQDLGWAGERIIANEIRILRSDEVADHVAEKLLLMAPGHGMRVDTLPILKAQSRPTTLRKIARTLNMENFFISLGLAQIDTSSALASAATISGRVRGQVSASGVTGLDFIEIVAESTSPIEAAHIANLIAEAYKRRNLDYARENMTTARSYLEDQLGMKRDSLSDAENELRNFQESKGVVSLDAESQGVVSQLSSFEAQREQKRIELETAQRVLNALRQQLKDIEPTLAKKMTEGADPVLKQLLSDKSQIEIDIQVADFNRKEALRKRPDLEPYFKKEMTDLARRLEIIKRKIDETTTQILGSDDMSGAPLDYARELKQKIIAAEIDIESRKATLEGLNRTIGEYSRKFDNIPTQMINYARLERRRQSFEKLSGFLDQKYQESVINEQTTLGSVDIIDQARPGTKPVRPNRPFNMLVGALVGLGLGIAVAVALRYLDNTIRSPEDVEKLGLPMLAFIPTFGTDHGIERHESLITLSAPQSPPSEAYRTLRTSIESILGGIDKCIAVIVSSPAPKEGKSTSVANLAVSAANSGRRVLLIDADLRRPVQHTIFEIDREPGLSNCLVGSISLNQAIKKTKIPGLHVATCGTIPSHPAELLGSSKMERFIALVRQYYDLILIDAPPVIAMSDTLVLARSADGVVLIVSADQTKTPGLVKAKEMLEANNANIAGIVVNRFNANRVYYSYYRYYYQSYYYYSDDGDRKKKRKRVETNEPVPAEAEKDA